MTPQGALTAFRYTFAALLILASAHTLTVESGPHAHALLLAPAEILGALLLAIRPFQILGARKKCCDEPGACDGRCVCGG